MKELFENLGVGVFSLIFFGGYFPVNMILAYIYGDKTDVIVSFFIPFYGYVVMLFS